MKIQGTVFEVAIVGSGDIAGALDQRRAAGAAPLSFAGAFSCHGSFRVSAVVEPDASRRAAFARCWDVERAVASFDELRADAGRWAVIALASPVERRARDLQDALALAPRLVFADAPLAATLAEANHAVEGCAREGVLLAVNHPRRWAPDVERLANQLKRGERGALGAVSAVYNGGLSTEGAQLIDLLHRLLGPLEITGVGAPVAGGDPQDPTVPASLRNGAGVTVQINAARAAGYPVFELQLVTASGVIAMHDGGRSWHERAAVGRGARRALDAGERRDGDLALAMQRAVANVHAALTNGSPLASTGATAVMAQMLAERIRRRALAAWPGAAAAPVPGDAVESR